MPSATSQPGFQLYYWPIPFRGHFIRYVLAHAGTSWEEAPTEALLAREIGGELSDSIDINLYRHLATVSGKEVVTLP